MTGLSTVVAEAGLSAFFNRMTGLKSLTVRLVDGFTDACASIIADNYVHLTKLDIRNCRQLTDAGGQVPRSHYK